MDFAHGGARVEFPLVMSCWPPITLTVFRLSLRLPLGAHALCPK